MKTTLFNEEVLFASEELVQIDASDILELKERAKKIHVKELEFALIKIQKIICMK